jgi:hypothetical protein
VVEKNTLSPKIRRIILWAVVLLICIGVGYSLHLAGKTFRLDPQSLQLIPRNRCQGIAAPSLLCKGGPS